ncbi:hypothetical protein MYCTH_2306935 [Thermothelomyces thermophilus ATCC 42464]|uniref:Uncharacterized protein n=1 Tax=Thermothelomyces thermophilus (strain ATCC 42464 / BCRC 31852 / DSM 1799) TaxID=573729 RepID=G2QF05_THET4|nr:uncharacterized protein MYCTH_2306935 [Thermothelomyces thermophilus ATCC 42464]AEO59034.1 hypothetical protein MYCTH_2306935 [Thermothelomyces thermophilus ATCC 42464]
MVRDRDGDGLGANQSKKPPAAIVDFADQPQQQPPQQYHRAKSQKHVVGGATGGRMHARIPSTKGLQKHHAAASTAKLTRKHGSLSPDRGGGAALASHHHRRATSELKLTRDPSATNLKKNTSHTNLRRNRSQAEVGKRTKSSNNLQRSVSNPAVNKLRHTGGSRVQFNLGDEDQNGGGDGDDDDDDEWVDASTSASPLLSRRGSAVSSAHTPNPPAANEGGSQGGSPTPHAEVERTLSTGTQNGSTNGAQHGAQHGTNSHSRDKSSHNQYLTSRILSRTPSHGAPPMMSTETVSARPSSIRQPSPPDSGTDPSQYLSSTPGTAAQARPGSSGKAELTSRFVGHNSQEPGSGLAGESFILAANRGGLSRAALSGKDEISVPKRRQSIGALSQSRGIDALNARRAAGADNGSDGEDDEERITRASRARRSGEYIVPRDMNRTQQKLNLQRASSSLEPAHPHPGIGIGPPGVAAGAGPLLGVPTTYDSRDPRINKMLERTGMEYLTVRRHLNPVARSISRVMQLPGLENSRRIPRPGTTSSSHGPRVSEQFNPQEQPQREREQPITSTSSMADLIHGGGASARRPPTPRSGGGGAYSALQSASSSLGTDDGSGRLHDRHSPGQGPNGHNGQAHRLSGSSLIDGTEDAGTVALLRMMWDKITDLSSSQE